MIGSLAELKERAVEGWDEFEGNTPHRPWIDRVKIRNPRTGNRMSRVPDVGNPWLDAGIVPFSTLAIQHQPRRMAEVVSGRPRARVLPRPVPQLVLFAALDGDDDGRQSPPFKNLFGHRLVMNEDGKPMHKSDGTAIWFEEAAEQLGVDTMRWMYLAQNPATDLRFGTRHPDRPVTLQTPDGPIEQTREGVADVRSGEQAGRRNPPPGADPAVELVRVLRQLRAARRVRPAPPAGAGRRAARDRPLDALQSAGADRATANREFAEFNAAEVCRQAADFIDDLSNWYIRRNRRRFWRSRDAGDRDKLAAYQTLYHVLVELTKLLAPLIPFLTERMYANLVQSWRSDAPESVHLCDYPQPDPTLLDPELNTRMAAAQRIVRSGPQAARRRQRARPPAAGRVPFRLFRSDASAESIEHLAEVVKEELNVKRLTRCDNLDGLATYTYKPNLKTLGTKIRQGSRAQSARRSTRCRRARSSRFAAVNRSGAD